jgi:hypothetical protein
MAASVPICAATSTGCHKGSKNRHPAGASPHSAQQPPEHRRVLIIGRGRHVLIADKQGIDPKITAAPAPSSPL